MAPNRLKNTDLQWLEIPTTTDNLGNDFILKKKYTSKRPTSWMLQEIAIHSLTNNTTIISNHKKGDSGEWSIFADKVSRNIPLKIDNVLQRTPDWEGPSFWLTNIREKPTIELLKILSLKDRKRLAKALPSKRAFFLRCLRLKNRTNRKGKGRRFREMKICLEVQGEIEQGLVPTSALGEISISEALTALGNEPGESKNLPFSRMY